MNREDIIRMAREAGLYYHPHGTCCMDEMFPFHFNPAEADKAYEKFAELIVKECAEVAFNDWCDGTNEGSSQMTILKHFGVEE